MNLEKNKKIKESFLKTREKRQSQVCKVFSIKIQNNKLNKIQKEQLKMLFVEAKWLKNDILNYFEQTDSLAYTIKKIVNKRNFDGSLEEKELQHLGSQMKQSVYADIISNLKTLSTLKKKNKPVGKLKYCSEYRCINLKQFGVTYKILDKNFIKIQNVKGKIKVNGLKQITDDYEYANAKLLNCPDGYHLKVTCFCEKYDIIPEIQEKIGIDMGIKNNLTLSNGLIFDASVQETDRLKKLQRQLVKKKKGSKNRNKHVKKLRVEYQKITNLKNELSNKIFNELNKYELIVIQDEMLSGWQAGLFGKQIQHSILGKIKAKIKKMTLQDKRFVIISKKHKTTQMCSKCGKIHKMNLKDREYTCECGNDIDRDLNSAINILKIGLEQIESTPVEKSFESSKKQEDAESLAQR